MEYGWCYTAAAVSLSCTCTGLVSEHRVCRLPAINSFNEFHTGPSLKYRLSNITILRT